MKAVRIGDPATLDNLDVFEADAPPAPGPGEVQVRLRASSLNFHDYAVVTGRIPAAAGRIPMSDGAGEVIAVGPGVTLFEEGDHVVSTFFPDWIDGIPPTTSFEGVPGDGIDGFAREIANVPELGLTRIPQGFTFAQAATLTCAGVTAWRALFVDDNLKPGDTVLVQGTGGVSIFALQLAKAAGAYVVATSSSDEKLERVRAMGADHTINYKSTPEWGDEVRKLTGGAGVDTIVEVGGPGTLNQSIRAIRVQGHIALIGVLTGQKGEVETARLMGKNARLQGLTVGSRAMQLDLIDAIEADGIEPVISDTFPLDRLADAFRHQESGDHLGKIVVEI